MKIFFLTAVLGFILLISIPSQAMDFYILGVNLKWLKDAEPKDYVMMAIGAGSSLIVHELGHYSYARLNNQNIDFHGTSYDLYSSSRQMQKNTAKAGFIAQSLIGLGLTSFDKTRHSYFTRGYTSFEATQLVLYDRKEDRYNDFNTIRKNGGNEDLFFWTISAVSAHNLLRQQW